MKPAGRKRDNKIAILKGYELAILEGGTIPLIRVDKVKTIPVPHYSTSWNDAKELWDELFDNNNVLEVVCIHRQTFGPEPEYGIGIKYTPKSGYDFDFLVLGKDFPDAVSQAWITWKEVKQ